MSGYPDEQPARPGMTAENERIVAFAIEKVRLPGVFMIAVSFLLMIHASLVVFNSQHLDQRFAEEQEKIDNDDKLDDQKRQEVKAYMAKTKDVLKVVAPVTGVVWALLCPLICFCAVRMLRLSSRGAALFGACVVMTPFTAGCCSIMGLPVGIWALTALSHPDVKAAFEIVRRARANPDGY